MRAGLAFGSNIGQRLENLRFARRSLFALQLAGPAFLASSIYETDPVDCEPGANRFWNAVVEIGFNGSADDLLQAAQKLERSAGRPANHPHNISRPLDIDLLYFGEEQINRPDLQIPHPRMFSRAFVLQPLAEIRPDLVLPGQTITVRDLFAETKASATVVALPEDWR